MNDYLCLIQKKILASIYLWRGAQPGRTFIVPLGWALSFSTPRFSFFRVQEMLWVN